MIDIRPANLRDASWIMANLRAADREETFCQLPDGIPTGKLAEWFITGGEAKAGQKITDMANDPKRRHERVRIMHAVRAVLRENGIEAVVDARLD